MPSINGVLAAIRAGDDAPTGPIQIRAGDDAPTGLIQIRAGNGTPVVSGLCQNLTSSPTFFLSCFVRGLSVATDRPRCIVPTVYHLSSM